MTTKQCNYCGRNLPLSEFYNKTESRLYGICKECMKQKSAERYRKTHPNVGAYHKRGELLVPIEGEEWRDVVAKGNMYYVSNIGRVAYKRRDNHLYLFTQRTNQKGYVVVGKKSVLAHRLVVTAFISDVPEGMVINHKNGIKTYNRVENIEIVTQKENVIHSIEILGKKHLGLKGRFGKDHHLSKPVLCFNKDGSFVKRYNGICEAARETNLGISNISAVCCGRPHCKTCGGYIWKFEQ